MSEPLHILLIEDSEPDAALLMRLLEHGFPGLVHERVETAEGMTDALDRQSWDLIVADYSLPAFGAMAALAMLRQRRLNPPLIVVSGVISDEAAVECMRQGAADYLLKDRLGRLEDAARHALAASRLRTEYGQVEQRIRFQAGLLDSVEQAVIAIDLNSAITYWNRFAEILYGWAAADVLGRAASLIVPGEPTTEQIAAIIAGLRSGGSWSGEFLVKRRDGSVFPAWVSNSPIHDEQGTLIGSVGVSSDITERKATEAALRESEQRYRQVEEHAPIGLALQAPDGRYLRVNPALCALVGYTEEELLARTFQDITHSDDLNADRDSVRRMLAGEITGCEAEKRYLRKGGTPVWIHLSVSLVRGEDASPLYFISQVQDISERKQTEHAAAHAQAVAKELAELRRREAEEAEAIAAVGAALAGALDPGTVYQIILAQAARVLPFDHAVIALYEDGWVVNGATLGGPNFAAGTRLVQIDPSTSTWQALSEGKPIYFADTAEVPDWKDPAPWRGPYRIRSLIVIPLLIDGAMIGSFQLNSYTSHFYTERHIRIAAVFGERAAQALRNARLYAAAQAARGEAQQAEKNLRAIIAAAPLPMVTFDLEGRIGSWNEAAEDVFGWRADEVIGRELPMVPDEMRHIPAAIRERAVQPEGLPSLEVRRQKKDGAWLDLLLSAAPLRDAADNLIGTMALYMDITVRKQGEEALRHQALHDSLTGLPNRVLLDELLTNTLRAARETGRSLCLLLLDLDRFKEVNDTLGHHIGDILLRHVAIRLQKAFGATEMVARLGGDEFAIVLPAADPAAALSVARLVIQNLAAPFQIGTHVLELGASIGVAMYPEHGTEARTLLQHADVAMYVAKRAQSGVALYESVLDQHTVRRLALMNDLRRSILDGGLFLYYQPKVSLADRRLWGVEALLRWSHPVHGFIPPDEFIPLAEQTGMIDSLTEWVLLTALAQAKAWRDAGRPIPIAINLSARSLQDQQFPDLVARHLQRRDLPASDLTLEITEGSMMTDPRRAREVLVRLHDLGLRLAIDDFGTGYSSLGYLKELPVDEVKIDKSFVLGMGAGDRKDEAIVRSVVAMAHSLGLQVVAEGVETQETLARLADMGCDVAQGYYLSRPLPIEALERWLGESPWAALGDVLENEAHRGECVTGSFGPASIPPRKESAAR